MFTILSIKASRAAVIHVLLVALCLFYLPAHAQTAVSGKITDAKGAALPGATVKVSNTTTGAVSDQNGNYSVTVPAPDATLVVSLVGYTSATIPLNGRSQVNVQLREEATGLNEVVVIGYQTVRRRDLTGATAVISAAQAGKVTANSIGESLQGLSPGVTVRTSGVPGQDAAIEIRGVASFLNTNPLYVIDGMIADANVTINQNDVESIQVLKDASAAAIYGARAANGVVIVTTKQGREGPSKFSLSAKFGLQQMPKRYDLMNSSEYAAMKRMQYTNSGLPAPASVAEATFDPSIDTDWQDEVLQTGQLQDYNLSVSGGSATSTYLVSGSHLNNTGFVNGTTFNRSSFRINTTTRRGRVTFGENMVLTNSNRKTPGNGNPIYDMATMLPVIPVRGDNFISANNPGGYGIGYGEAVTYAYNPVAVRELGESKFNYAKLVGNAYIDVKLTDWLNYRFNTGLEVSFDYNRTLRETGIWQYNAAVYPSSVSEQRSRYNSLLMDHTLNFNKVLDKHSINGVVGFTQQRTQSEFTTGGRTNLVVANNTYYNTIGSATGTMTSDGGVPVDFKLYGYIGRINYGYNDRYLLTLTGRLDQDSRVGIAHRSGFFPSVAGAWRISKESFFKADWVSDLKINASWGQLGVLPSTLGSWPFTAYINNNPRAIFGVDQNENVGAYQAQLANPDLRWEKREQTNLGFTAAFLNNAISAEFNVYNSLSKDAILDLPLPGYLGNLVSNPYVNTASIRNRGIELSATYRHTTQPFTWDISANFTTIANKVMSVGTQGEGINYLTSGNTRSQIGGSVGEWYLLETAGLFQSTDEIANYKNQAGKVIQPNSKPGDVKYLDLNGDGEISAADRSFRGSPWPTLQTGLQFNAGYKQFSLNIQLVGVFGNKIYNDVKRQLDTYQNTNFRGDLNPWTPSNTSATDPRIALETGDQGISVNNYSYSDRWLESGSYVRMRNIEVGYTFPKTMFKAANINTARLFISAQNLFTISKYSGLDPDVTGSNIQERGLDAGHWPSPRVFSIGLNAEF